MYGRTCRLSIVEAVAHCDVAGSSCLLLFLEVSVKHTSRIQTKSDLCDVIGIFNLCDLTADFFTNLRVAANYFYDTSLFNS